MDSAITSAPRTDRAFTLTEVIIASALSAFIMAGVLSAFVFIGRSGFRTSSVSEMETEVRRALETFAEDARRANDINWTSAQSITLYMTSGGDATQVTYAYDASDSGATSRCLYRIAGDVSTQPKRILVRNLASDFAFKRYKLEQSGVSDNTASNNLETKQIQLVMRAQRTSAATAGVTQSVVSARYILRNKKVSN